jgi:pilus assembly protein Flp/PilA
MTMFKFSGSTIVMPAVMPMLRFLRDESGATSIEYAVIASGVAVAIAATVVTLGSSVKGLFTSVATVMN